jgi:hypothetical protein
MANTQTTVPIFVAAQVLEANQLNQSAATGVPVFATTVTRDAGFGGAGEKPLAEGQLCYLESTNVVQYYDGAAWATVGPASSGAVVQVKSTTLTSTFSGTATLGTFMAVTGLTVAITPTSASNKVLVLANLVCTNNNGGQGLSAILTGGNCASYVGDAAGSRQRSASATSNGTSSYTAQNMVFNYLDSPATTSATTYGISINYLANSAGTNVLYVNRSGDDSDVNYVSRNASTITVMEVAP